jgi:predicted RNA polymerase sigma factor
VDCESLDRVLEIAAANPAARYVGVEVRPLMNEADLATLIVDDRVNGAHRVDSVRAHLFEMAGDHRAAHAAYQHAARRTTSVPERRHLLTRAAHLMLDDDGLTA